MTLEEFKATLEEGNPPLGLSEMLEALWHDAKGNWDKAHQLAQGINNADGAWVHAYLHRVEGDEGNASYWYRNAGKSFCKLSLEEEWETLVNEFLT